MKRSGFKRPALPRVRVPAVPIPPETAARIRYAGAANAPEVAKSKPMRHQRYLRLVAALPCACCGLADRSQAAHPNEGKGMAMKTDDRLCFPMCADGPGYVGCHSRLDQGALYPRDERRRFERLAGQRTRAHITSLGLWPADLPAWPGDLERAA